MKLGLSFGTPDEFERFQKSFVGQNPPNRRILAEMGIKKHPRFGFYFSSGGGGQSKSKFEQAQTLDTGKPKPEDDGAPKIWELDTYDAQKLRELIQSDQPSTKAPGLIDIDKNEAKEISDFAEPIVSAAVTAALVAVGVAGSALAFLGIILTNRRTSTLSTQPDYDTAIVRIRDIIDEDVVRVEIQHFRGGDRKPYITVIDRAGRRFQTEDLYKALDKINSLIAAHNAKLGKAISEHLGVSVDAANPSREQIFAAFGTEPEKADDSYPKDTTGGLIIEFDGGDTQDAITFSEDASTQNATETETDTGSSDSDIDLDLEDADLDTDDTDSESSTSIGPLT